MAAPNSSTAGQNKANSFAEEECRTAVCRGTTMDDVFACLSIHAVSGGKGSERNGGWGLGPVSPGFRALEKKADSMNRCLNF